MLLEIGFEGEEIAPCLSERRIKSVTVLKPFPAPDVDFAPLHLDDDEAIMGKRHEISFANAVVPMPGDPQGMQHRPFVAKFSTQSFKNTLFRVIISHGVFRKNLSHTSLSTDQAAMANDIQRTLGSNWSMASHRSNRR